MVSQEYKICKRCIMDTSDPEITFNEHGFCNHCTTAIEVAKISWFPNKEGEEKLDNIIKKIKAEGKGKDYDCILGLSGGVDSSFLAYNAVKYGLRPLVVHVDCGWNSELAVKNIENIVKLLNLELHTHVVDWEEMKNLQIAFLKANVPNQDIPQDHAIFAGLYKFAVKNNVKYVLNGSNFATECILPKSWGHIALDCKHLKSINKIFGKGKLKKYPYVSFFKRYIYYTYFKKMTIIKLLNYIPYSKEKAIEIMSNEIGWRYYGNKHHESRFTKFFQTYYLPVKFGYNKKRAHLSSLIVSGFLTRDKALEEMNKIELSNVEIEEEIEYIAKKLDMTKENLIQIIKQPNRAHNEFPNNENIYKFGFKIRDFFKL